MTFPYKHMRTRHLKTRIALSLMLFIGLGMFLIDLVLGFMGYRQLVKTEMIQAKATLAAISHHIQSPPLLSLETIQYLDDLTQITNLGIVMVGAQDEVVYQSKLETLVVEQLTVFVGQNLRSEKVEKKFYGGSFGIFGVQYEHIFMVQSLRSSSGVILGAVGVDVALCSFVESIWDGQRLVLVYVFFNLVVLSGLAYWRFSHFLIIPLQQIAEKAASYQDEDMYLTSDFQTDDVSKLSRSLDQMFRRIHHDRDELQKMVATLEEVNGSLRQAQSDVVRAEKLASVGRLSAGIAHEIGNPIGIVLGYLELLKGEDITPEERTDFTTRAIAEIQRINKIIRQLLDLARPMDDTSRMCSVHEILESFKDDLALQAVIGDMRLQFDLTAESDGVDVDAEKLRQVFLNLLLNGADAVKDVEGVREMVIRTRIVETDSRETRLEICFIDTGSGIDPIHMKQVFDPFFTTKEVGKGTGLGLSVSYMIIENAGGTIKALSEPGKVGTTFRIVLPLCTQDTQEDKENGE